jgi:hypothetical protein
LLLLRRPLVFVLCFISLLLPFSSFSDAFVDAFLEILEHVVTGAHLRGKLRQKGEAHAGMPDFNSGPAQQ